MREYIAKQDDVECFEIYELSEHWLALLVRKRGRWFCLAECFDSVLSATSDPTILKGVFEQARRLAGEHWSPRMEFDGTPRWVWVMAATGALAIFAVAFGLNEVWHFLKCLPGPLGLPMYLSFVAVLIVGGVFMVTLLLQAILAVCRYYIFRSFINRHLAIQ